MPIISTPNPLNALSSAAEGFNAGQEQAEQKRERLLQEAYQKQQDEKNDLYRQQTMALERQRADDEHHKLVTGEETDRINRATEELRNHYGRVLGDFVNQAITEGAKQVMAEHAKTGGVNPGTMQQLIAKAMHDWDVSGHDRDFVAEGQRLLLKPEQIQSEMNAVHQAVGQQAVAIIKQLMTEYKAQEQTPGQQLDAWKLNYAKKHGTLPPTYAQTNITPEQAVHNSIEERRLALEAERTEMIAERLAHMESTSGDKLSTKGRLVYDTINSQKLTQAAKIKAVKNAHLNPSDTSLLLDAYSAVPDNPAGGAKANTAALEASHKFRALTGEQQNAILTDLKGGASPAGAIQDIQNNQNLDDATKARMVDAIKSGMGH